MIKHVINDISCTLNDDNLLHSFDDQPAAIHPNGKLEWYKHGLLHRDNDLPALISDVTEKWYQNGLLHRDNDQPAVINFEPNYKQWYQYDKLHRDNDQPAIVSDTFQSWYNNGERHRIGQASIIYNDGSTSWYCNDLLHRTDGPAFYNKDGIEEWRINGILHRKNGPAEITRTGIKRWYNEGMLIKEYDPRKTVWYKIKNTSTALNNIFSISALYRDYYTILYLPYYTGVKTRKECEKHKLEVVKKMFASTIKSMVPCTCKIK